MCVWGVWSHAGPFPGVATEAERVARSPGVQRGAKITADVGMGVVKLAAPVVGNIGKFAAGKVFSVSGGWGMWECVQPLLLTSALSTAHTLSGFARQKNVRSKKTISTLNATHSLTFSLSFSCPVAFAFAFAQAAVSGMLPKKKNGKNGKNGKGKTDDK